MNARFLLLASGRGGGAGGREFRPHDAILLYQRIAEGAARVLR
jgi:hypothetical protein